MIKYLVIICHF